MSHNKSSAIKGKSNQKNLGLKNKALNEISINNLSYLSYLFVDVTEISFNLRARIEELENNKDLEAIVKMPNLLEKCVNEYESFHSDILPMEAVDNILYNELEKAKQKQNGEEM